MSDERNEFNRVAGSGYLDGFPEPEDLMRIVDRLEAADTLLAECRRYVTAMEDAAAESLGIYDHSKRSKSGIEKRLDYYFENTKITRGDSR